MRKLAVICPGIGYHKDKPLLYFAAKLAQKSGFEIIGIAYSNMPQKIRGNAEMMRNAAALAIEQTAQQIETADPSRCTELLLIGKSIGTIAAAHYAQQCDIPVRQIWYTPLEATFSFAPPADSCIAFLGSADPWSDVQTVRRLADEQNIPLSLYEGCNHSLESGDVLRDTEILHDVMQKTSCFLNSSFR